MPFYELMELIDQRRCYRTNRHAAVAILDKQAFYTKVEGTYEGIRLVDRVPNLSPQKLVSVEIGKNFILSHGYIKNDFDVSKWAAPEFHEIGFQARKKGRCARHQPLRAHEREGYPG